MEIGNWSARFWEIRQTNTQTDRHGNFIYIDEHGSRWRLWVSPLVTFQTGSRYSRSRRSTSTGRDAHAAGTITDEASERLTSGTECVKPAKKHRRPAPACASERPLVPRIDTGQDTERLRTSRLQRKTTRSNRIPNIRNTYSDGSNWDKGAWGRIRGIAGGMNSRAEGQRGSGHRINGRQRSNRIRKVRNTDSDSSNWWGKNSWDWSRLGWRASLKIREAPDIELTGDNGPTGSGRSGTRIQTV